MTDIRKLAFVGLASLGLFTIGSVGCSSSGGTGTGGSGGTSSGTGGTSSHTGGATGSGGTSTGTGGSGGAAATVGCQMSDAPTSADIATFASADAGLTIMGGYYVYGSATPNPTYTPGTGSISVTDVVQVAAANNYQGFGIFFNGNSAGTDCIDAHTYTGVQFDISGSLMGANCTIQFSITDSAHSDSTVLKADGTVNDPKASGPKGSYSPQLDVPATDFTSTPMTIKVPFTGPTGGSPAITTTPLDPTKIEGVQWQMTTPIAADGGATECNLSMTLANVKFC